MIAYVKANKKFSAIVTEMSLREQKVCISFVLISQSYFKVSKIIRLNTTHFLIMKISNKRELQQIGSSHLPDMEV